MKKYLFVSILIGLFASCNKGPDKSDVSDPAAYTEFISSYTSGLIGTTDDISVQFSSSPAEEVLESPSGLIRVNPPVSGVLNWDNNKLIFTPEKRLKPGTTYEISVDLSMIFPEMGDLQPFVFMVKTMEADFRLQVDGYRLSAIEGEMRSSITGSLMLSDRFDAKKAEKMLEATQNNKKLDIGWSHDEEELTHSFEIKNIQRTDRPSEVKINCDGDPLDIDRKEEATVAIPGSNEFILLNHQLSLSTSPQIILTFSDPIDPEQETDGMFTLDHENVQAMIEVNVVRLLCDGDVQGTKNVIVDGGLKNDKGKPLGMEVSFDVDFEPKKPEVHFLGEGSIVPSADGIEIPFYAVNLEAVDINIVQIFQSNVLQFLQDYNLNEGSELRKVGRPVYHGKLSLRSQHEILQNKGSAYNLNLSDLITVEPGAIYQVELSMRPSYSLYPCDQDADIHTREIKNPPANDYWSNPDSWYLSDWFYYNQLWNWQESDNPCHTAYYSPDRRAHKNVIASNLGLLVQQGQDQKLEVVTTNLLSGKPEADVDLELYDFQLQLITSVQSGSDGMVVIEPERQPFALLAIKGNDRSYIKLNEGSALQLSQFDVGGREVQEGLKGYLYGERNVWRPGDSIYMSLIVQDQFDKLGSDYPVIFELYNPVGQLMQKAAIPLKQQIVTFKTSTGEEAMTGRWNLVARLGAVEFSHAVRIETIKPNRLKIDFKTTPEIIRADRDENRVQLTARWLHGTPASGMKAQVEMQLRPGSPGSTEFKGFQGYTFTDEVEAYQSETQVVFEDQLDQNGEAQFNLQLGSLSGAPGVMNAVFIPRVFEPGGDFSISQFSRTLYPYPVFAGFRFAGEDPKSNYLPTGSEAKLEVAAVDPDGKGINTAVDVKIYKVHWRWWWDASGDYLGNYMQGDQYQPVVSKRIRTVDGKGSLTFTVSNEDWGRYLVVVSHNGGHKAARTVYFDWGDGGSHGSAAGATMLTLSTKKEKYSAGENIQCSFPSAKGQKALVSIENGSMVLKKFWIDTDEEITRFTINAEREMAPNIYVFVTLLQSYEQTTNDRPIRLYGVIPVMVEDPDTHLNPVIDMPDELRSQKPFTVKVSEKSGRSMNYTLAVVDEGLLDLTAFSTPDPWKSFFAREALGVHTWDLYDYVLGAYGGTLERLFAVGGDEGVLDPSQQKTRRFKPVVKFLGPFKLNKGRSASHEITLPQYTGSVRVMVVAASENGYGKMDKTVPVADPLMVLATVPRVLGIQESFSLPVSVFVQKAGLKEVQVSIEANDLLNLGGEKSQTVAFDEPAEKDLYFTFTTGSVEGKATIRVNATAQNESASYDVEVEVRNPNPPVVVSESKVISGNSSWEVDVKPIGLPATSTNTLELSTAPSLNLGKRLAYLINYPHGCIEQTVSAAFPQVLLVKEKVTGGVSTEKMEENVNAGLKRLHNFQLSNGSFSYWPGGNDLSDWGTSYAGHFMLEAEKAGFAISGEMKKSWLKYQRNAASYWRKDYSSQASILEQAYRLYTLALAGQPQTGAMNRLREMSDLPIQARWQLASAYALAGRSEVAATLVDFTNLKAPTYPFPGRTFGSSLRDQAILLDALILMNRREEAMELAIDLSKVLSSNDWMSTQTTAFCLVSMSHFIQMMGASGTQADVTVKKEGETKKLKVGAKPTVIEIENRKSKIENQESKASPSLTGIENRKSRIENMGAGSVYATLVRRGIPLDTEVPVQQSGISLRVFYTDMSGNRVDMGDLKQGTDFECSVIVKNLTSREVNNLALTQVFPSGWEIINERLTGMEEAPNFDYRDIRDDRVLTYFDLRFNQEKEFRIRLNASYAGSFLLPGATCEAMYDNRISANVAAWRVEVIKQ